MGVKDLFHRLTTPVAVLDQEDLRTFCAARAGTSPIAEVRPRQQATVVGEISSVRVVPRPDGTPWLEATLSDGTGTLTVMWTGRRKIAGVRPGARLVVSGRGIEGHNGRLKLINPVYELL